MLSLTAGSLCLLDGKHNIVPPIIPEEQEFVHFNTLWCYLFYRLSGEEKEDKGIAAFTIVPSKNLTISALLDRQFPPIAETNHKPLLFVTTKTVAYIRDGGVKKLKPSTHCPSQFSQEILCHH
jgi:hypothetical protein